MSESKARLLVKLINNLDSTGDIKPEGIVEGIDVDIDSDNIFSLIDSAHLLSRSGVADSNFILGLTSSDYIQKRVTLDGVGIDSSDHFQLIDSDYLLQRAGTSSGITQASFLNVVDGNYIRTKANLPYDRTGIDSNAVLALADSAYIISKSKTGTDSATFLSDLDSDYIRLKTKGIRSTNSTFSAVSFNTIDSLPATSTDGEFAYIKNNKRLYIGANTNWVSVALLNEHPEYLRGVPSEIIFEGDSVFTFSMIGRELNGDSSQLTYSHKIILDSSNIIDSISNVGELFTVTTFENYGTATAKFAIDNGTSYAFAPEVTIEKFRDFSILDSVSIFTSDDNWSSTKAKLEVLWDGSALALVEDDGDLYYKSISTAYDLSTVSNMITGGTRAGSYWGPVRVSRDKSQIYIGRYYDATFQQRSQNSTDTYYPFNHTTTATFVDAGDTSANNWPTFNTERADICMTANGRHVYLVNPSLSTILQVTSGTMTTPNQISTMTWDAANNNINVYNDVSGTWNFSNTAYSSGIATNFAGTKIWISDANNIFQFSIATPGDLTTISYDGNISRSSNPGSGTWFSTGTFTGLSYANGYLYVLQNRTSNPYNVVYQLGN